MAPGRSLVLLACLVACAVDRAGETATTGESTTTGGTSTSSGPALPTTGATTGANAGTTGGPADTDGSSGTTAELDAQCEPLDQACPPGQKCTWTELEPAEPPGWDTNMCLPARPDGGGFGDPCRIDEGESVFSGLDDCAAGFFCLGFEFMTGEGGRCVEFCDEEGNCPNSGGAAAFCVEGSVSLGLLGLCYVRCDPVIQDCPDPEGCYGDPSLPDFLCVEPDPAAGERGAPCQFVNDCLPGLICQTQAQVEGCPPGEQGCCTPFCSVSGGDGPCAPSEDCVPFYPAPPPGLGDVGVCVIPG